MGWNDRLPEDPYTPPESFYRDRDDYEAWLEYVEAQLDKENAQLVSQNIDPATLKPFTQQEAPARQHLLTRIWAAIFGQDKNQEEKEAHVNEEKEGLPF